MNNLGGDNKMSKVNLDPNLYFEDNGIIPFYDLSRYAGIESLNVLGFEKNKTSSYENFELKGKIMELILEECNSK